MKKIALVLTILPLFLHSAAFARLGDAESTVESDRQAMHGARKMITAESYRVHEITNAAGTVREYVSPDGMVFGVTWSGLSHPDLTQLFGSYYQEYADADAATVTPRGRAPKSVKSANVVSIRFGHMRDVHGKAFIPSLVPQGLDVNSLP